MQEITEDIQNRFLKKHEVEGSVALFESGEIARINLSRRHLKPEDCRILTSILTRPKVAQRLAILDLSGAEIGVQGTKKLVEALPDLVALKEFRLCDNQLGADGIKTLAASLKGLEHVRTLSLSRNGIGKDGVKELGPSLRNLKKLDTLGLGGNKICAEGAKELSFYIKGLDKLKMINLSYNLLGDEGVGYILMVLSSLPNLTTLNLTGVSVTQKGQKLIDDSRTTFPRLSIYT